MPSRLLNSVLGRLVIFVLYGFALLPISVAKPLAGGLGRALGLFMHRRRLIVSANIKTCFPKWDERSRRELGRQIFQSLGLSIYEIALAWCRRDSRHLPDCKIDGLEHVNAAVQQGRGVLLVNGHFTCLEICSRYLAEAMPLSGVYRPLKNPVLESFQTKARLRYARTMLSKRNPKEILTALKQGQIVWFAPDQDFGPQRSVFVPFFNVPAATLTATWRLARSSGAVVLTATPVRLANGGYQITIDSALPGVDAAEPEELLTGLNQRIESAVRTAPADYWWFHRRFKTTPNNSQNIYSNTHD